MAGIAVLVAPEPDPLLLPEPDPVPLPDPDPLPLPDPDPLPLPDPDPLPLPDPELPLPDPEPLPDWNSRGLADRDTLAFPDPDPLPLPDPELPLPDPVPPLPDPEPLPLPEPDPLPLPDPELLLPDPELLLPDPELVVLGDGGPVAIASVALSTTTTVLPERLKMIVRERSGETAMRVGWVDSPAKATAEVDSLLLIALMIFRAGDGIPPVGNNAFETNARNLKPLSLCCVAELEDFFPPQDITPTLRTTSTARLVRVLGRVQTPKDKDYEGQNL
jgi:hypothetical protein